MIGGRGISTRPRPGPPNAGCPARPPSSPSLRPLRVPETPPALVRLSTISSLRRVGRDRARPLTSAAQGAGGSATSSSTSSRRDTAPDATSPGVARRLHRSVRVVGDGAQAIYAFAGADALPLTDSSPLPAARSLWSTTTGRQDAPSQVGGRAGPASGGARSATRCLPGRSPCDDRRSRTTRREVAMVADTCWQEFTGGVPWHRMAILLRTNAQSSAFETALARRIPFRLTGSQRFGAARGARTIDRSGEAEARAPARPSLTTSPTSAMMPTPTPKGRSISTRRRHQPGKQPAGAARRRNHLRAASSSTEHRGDAPSALGDYAATEPGTAAHRSPGSSRGSSSRCRVRRPTRRRPRDVSPLCWPEWRVVFVTGLERGLVPISWAGTLQARAEERRLLHVALGRAEDWVQCSWVRERTAHGRRDPPGDPVADELQQQAIARAPVAPVDRTDVSAMRCDAATRRKAGAHEPRPPPATDRLSSARHGPWLA